MQADTGLSAISGIVVGGTPATTLIFDTFTDTNGTNLTAHTADTNQGTGWLADTGTITVQSNQANCGSGFPYYAIDAGQANVTITALVTPTGTAAAGVSGRVSNATNSWDIDIDAVSGGHLFIYEQVSGTFTVRASTTAAISSGTQYTVQAVFSGNNVTATVNGGNQIAYGAANSNQTVTKHGINLAGSWNADNFKV